MKATKAVKINENMVGVEVLNIQDVVKAQAAGLELVDKEGWGYDYTTDDEETGEEVEPTEQEIFERITKDLAEGKEVYACMILSDDFDVQEHAKTNLKTNFYLHQQVYTMHENKITEGEIVYLSLSAGSMGNDITNSFLSDTAEKLYYKIGFMFKNSLDRISRTTQEEISGIIKNLAMGAFVVIKITGKAGHGSLCKTRDLEEIFATKEELVANLMQD